MSVDQPELGLTAPTRASDPGTSKRAAVRAGRGMGRSKARMLGAFEAGALTAQEAAELLVRRGWIGLAQMDSHRRRAPDLANDGFLERCGETSGIVYQLTSKGRAALDPDRSL